MKTEKPVAESLAVTFNSVGGLSVWPYPESCR